jgi:hypothetical protein
MSNEEIIAHILHSRGVPSPGPGAGIQAVNSVAAARKAIEAEKDEQFKAAMQIYVDNVIFITTVWAHQQKLLLDRLEAAYVGARPHQHEAIAPAPDADQAETPKA